MVSMGFVYAGMVNTAVSPPLYSVHMMNVKIHQLTTVILARNVLLKWEKNLCMLQMSSQQQFLTDGLCWGPSKGEDFTAPRSNCKIWSTRNDIPSTRNTRLLSGGGVRGLGKERPIFLVRGHGCNYNVTISANLQYSIAQSTSIEMNWLEWLLIFFTGFLPNSLILH